MKYITIDFKNDMVVLMMEGNKGSAHAKINKASILEAMGNVENDVSNLIIGYDNITFDFENNTISGNETVMYEKGKGHLYPMNKISPVRVLKFKNSGTKFDAIIGAMGYEEYSADEIKEDVKKILNSLF